MNQLPINQPPKNHTSGCAEEANTAEQELTAFFRAVMNLFGPQQAELSADDWLNELTATETLPSSTREWRAVTLKASARLAARVNALFATNYSCQALASICS
ncbi:MAG TPA: hypothetical protein VGK22_10355 [Candidatus Angelobacter sp.]|jgi:alkylhydroperoxidase/carboxymuconolactone decarboxylase family protein YurZ